MISKGFTQKNLQENEIIELIEQAISKYNFKNKKILCIIPDNTRTAPIPLFFKLFCKLIKPLAHKLDFLIALGTHPPLSEEKINILLGITNNERKNYAVNIFNHFWNKKEALTTIGTIDKNEIYQISSGLMKEDVPVIINKLIFEYDLLIIIGPTFPHEVVGFSGGNKYFFPGISGSETIHFFHWLGALITNPIINGTKYTPVRKVVDRCASFIKIPRLCFSLVVSYQGLQGLFIDTPEKAYDKAADLSSQIHIIYKSHPFKKVLSIAPLMYDDIWTAGKCMYKLEPVVKDNGELIIYAPHIDEISYSHGKIIDKIGYHTRDYFVKQMDKFKDIPRGIMAHSTHVKGIGTFENNKENPRINVVLATKISEERCKKVNLDYKNPLEINITDFENKENEGILLVKKAGEMLYKLKK